MLVPACGRATAVVVLLAAVRYGLDPRSNLVEAIGGLAAGILAAGAVLWWSSWAELDGMRKLVRGLLPH